MKNSSQNLCLNNQSLCTKRKFFTQAMNIISFYFCQLPVRREAEDCVPGTSLEKTSLIDVFIIFATWLKTWLVKQQLNHCGPYTNEFLEIFEIWWCNPLVRQPTKWSNPLKQFIGFCLRIVWVCLTILRGFCLEG